MEAIGIWKAGDFVLELNYDRSGRLSAPQGNYELFWMEDNCNVFISIKGGNSQRLSKFEDFLLSDYRKFEKSEESFVPNVENYEEARLIIGKRLAELNGDSCIFMKDSIAQYLNSLQISLGMKVFVEGMRQISSMLGEYNAGRGEPDE